MALKAVLSQADYEAQPEAIRQNYAQGQAAGTFVLLIDGQHPDVAAANLKVSEFRDHNIRLMRDAEAIGKLKSDAEKEAADLREKLQQATVSQAAADAAAAIVGGTPPAGTPPAKPGDAPAPPAGTIPPKPAVSDVELLIQRAVEAATKPLAERIAEKDKAEQELSRKLAEAELDKEVASVAGAIGIRTTAIEDVRDRAAKAGFRWKDGKAVAMEGDTPKYSAIKPGEVLTLTEWMSGLSKTADHLFKPSVGSGAAVTRQGVPMDGGVMVNPSPLEFGKNAEQIASGKVKVELR